MLRVCGYVPDFVLKRDSIDSIHKRIPLKNCFVSIRTTSTELVFELIIQKKLYS